MNLKVDKACGPNCISVQLLQKSVEYISSLGKLFQLSLSSGKLPCDWVTVIIIIPVYTKGDKTYASSFQLLTY